MCRHLDILAGHGGWLLFAILFVGANPSGQYDVWAAWLAVQVPAYRRADGERRQQLKWLYSGAAVTLIAFIFGAFIIPIALGQSFGSPANPVVSSRPSSPPRCPAGWRCPAGRRYRARSCHDPCPLRR